MTNIMPPGDDRDDTAGRQSDPSREDAGGATNDGSVLRENAHRGHRRRRRRATTMYMHEILDRLMVHGTCSAPDLGAVNDRPPDGGSNRTPLGTAFDTLH